MATAESVKQEIRQRLQDLHNPDLTENARAFWQTLGYVSERYNPNADDDPEFFVETLRQAGLSFEKEKNFREKALVGRWRRITLLFQLTDDEIRKALQRNQSLTLFESNGQVNLSLMQSYLFYAVDLEDSEPFTRTDLANITREINRLYLMPVLILFRHGDTVTLAVQDRRINKTNVTQHVLEKVTLIKDIRLENPHRAHLEILHDLSFVELNRLEQNRNTPISNFDRLHASWRYTLDTDKLSSRFYKELANWYFWACSRKDVIYPRTIKDIKDEKKCEEQKALFWIRLLTRLMFCWFLCEKGLIPDELFSRQTALSLLKDSSPQSGDYYKAFLQNLFFATLNQEPGKRAWRKEGGNRGVPNLWRYKGLLKDSSRLESLLRDQIPFVNGGLFECLDTVLDGGQENKRYDDFSEEKGNDLRVPFELFFSLNAEVNLSQVYNDTRHDHEQVLGIIEIFNRFKFTVEENTPIEEEIALDPELLGKVFENLLASYNPETATTARKKTGSFYTPRAIVGYMVDEGLIAYLNTKAGVDVTLLRRLFLYSSELATDFLTEPQISALVAAIDSVKILDPACGSGAFPMGALQKLAFLLRKLDPNNVRWEQRQRDAAEAISDSLIREATIKAIDNAFSSNNERDYARKLYLIQECIYGVDIQPIAVQIAKLRFFISLVIEQKPDFTNTENYGIAALPNLETKIVTANALISPKRPEQLSLLQVSQVSEIELDLMRTRQRYFDARTPETKRKYRDKDAELRAKLVRSLEQEGWPADTAARIAKWNPYDQEDVAEFFDPEWMFGLRGDGKTGDKGVFDLVIANPPYVRQEQIKEQKPALAEAFPEIYNGTADLYTYFYGLAVRLLKPGGTLSFISSNKWFRAGYGVKLRKHIAEKCQVENIIDFGDLQVFETAIAYPLVFIARKNAPTSSSSPSPSIGRGGEGVRAHQPSTRFTRVTSLAPPYPDVHAVTEQSGILLPQNAIRGEEWNIADATTTNRILEMTTRGKTLGAYVNGRIYRGVLTGFNQAFVINGDKRAELIAADPKSTEIIRPLAAGRDIKRWVVNSRDQWLIVTKIGVDMKRYPAIMGHLSQWETELRTRQDQGNHWWELRSCAYYDAFDEPKICYPDIANDVRFAYDTSGTYFPNTCYFVALGNLYVLGILNSKAVENFYVQLSAQIRGGYLRFFRHYVEQIPIPDATPEQESVVGRFASYMLFLYSHDRTTLQDGLLRDYFEQILNGLAHELYFPEEVHTLNIHLFDALAPVDLPDLEAIAEAERLPRLRSLFDTLYDNSHPVRNALFQIGSLLITQN